LRTATTIELVAERPPVSPPSTSPDADGRRSDARSVAKWYRRADRAVTWLVALAVAGAFLVSVAVADLVPALAVAAILLVAVRAPVLRRRGTTRLRTDAPPEAVVEEFASATPPVLAFQWAIADEVRPASDGSGGRYEHASLLGLRSHSLAVETEVQAPPDSAQSIGDGEDDGDAVARVRIGATLDGQPWGAYSVAVSEAVADGVSQGSDGRGGTVVDVEFLPRRRFGLRSVPRALVADAYHADAFATQGYEVVDRDVSFGV
jgi:hypothetical protein